MRGANGEEVAEGDGSLWLDMDKLSILPKFVPPLSIPYRNIVDASAADFALRLVLTSGETLSLERLGYKYEDFVRVFTKLRNEVLLKDSLMNESLRKAGVSCTYSRTDENGREVGKGRCQLRLYDTGLVLMPEVGNLTRIPYSYIARVEDADYVLQLNTESGETYSLSGMGGDFISVRETLASAISELGLKAQESLRALVPDADPSAVWSAARFMREGRAASKAEIESVSPDMWAKLEMRLGAAGINEEYEFLKSIYQPKELFIGMKRGLMGDLTGDYIWFLVPICSQSPDQPGNALAMEASAGEGGGRATYFFRIMSRASYRAVRDARSLDQQVGSLARLLNQCMLEINFRREPIYFPDAKFEEPRYANYRFAVRKLKGLQTLRNLYIGRVIHSSPEQWKEDVMDLLSFNTSTVDEAARWTKTGQGFAGEEG